MGWEELIGKALRWSRAWGRVYIQALVVMEKGVSTLNRGS